MRSTTLLRLFPVLLLAACDATTAPSRTVQVRFASPAVAGASLLTADSTGLVIEGSNGTLVIRELKLVVDRLELRSDVVTSCTDSAQAAGDDDDRDHCPAFRTNLFVADVPVGTGAVTVAADAIPAGTYTGLKFKVKDLEVDEDDDDDVGQGTRIQALLTQLRLTYPTWPGQASMMVEGTFTPTGGTARPFRAFFEAEIEVESPLNPPVVIDSTSTGVQVDLRPDRWFRRIDGTVMDLSALDFAATGRVIEFEQEFEDGIDSHHDDDHDEDDDEDRD
jgi:hypothetical protein